MKTEEKKNAVQKQIEYLGVANCGYYTRSYEDLVANPMPNWIYSKDSEEQMLFRDLISLNYVSVKSRDDFVRRFIAKEFISHRNVIGNIPNAPLEQIRDSCKKDVIFHVFEETIEEEKSLTNRILHFIPYDNARLANIPFSFYLDLDNESYSNHSIYCSPSRVQGIVNDYNRLQIELFDKSKDKTICQKDNITDILFFEIEQKLDITHYDIRTRYKSKRDDTYKIYSYIDGTFLENTYIKYPNEDYIFNKINDFLITTLEGSFILLDKQPVGSASSLDATDKSLFEFTLQAFKDSYPEDKIDFNFMIELIRKHHHFMLHNSYFKRMICNYQILEGCRHGKQNQKHEANK